MEKGDNSNDGPGQVPKVDDDVTIPRAARIGFPKRPESPIKRGMTNTRLLVRTALASLTLALGTPRAGAAEPIHALLVTGGCCHNYVFQSKALTEAVSQRAKVKWTVVNEGGKGTRAMIDLYDDPDWAKPYDVVVHNECFANTKDPDYVRKITRAHRDGAPAVVIHCAMHTYRAATFDDWREAELARLEEERRKLDEMRHEFDEYLRELRRAKDQKEFDEFMASRNGKPAPKGPSRKSVPDT